MTSYPTNTLVRRWEWICIVGINRRTNWHSLRTVNYLAVWLYKLQLWSVERLRTVGSEFPPERIVQGWAGVGKGLLRFGRKSEYLLADTAVIPVGGDELIRRACTQIGRNLSIAEWREAFGTG